MNHLHFRIGKEGPPCGYGLFCYHNDPDIAEGLICLWRNWTLWWGWVKRAAPLPLPQAAWEEAARAGAEAVYREHRLRCTQGCGPGDAADPRCSQCEVEIKEYVSTVLATLKPGKPQNGGEK